MNEMAGNVTDPSGRSQRRLVGLKRRCVAMIGVLHHTGDLAKLIGRVTGQQSREIAHVAE